MKMKCDDCKYIFENKDILSGISPFNGDNITGCPQCKSVFGTYHKRLCDQGSCDAVASGGWLSITGYRVTCEEHAEMREEA